MTPTEFLREFFSLSPGRKINVRAVPSKKPYDIEIDDLLEKKFKLQKYDPTQNWYFGAAPRESDEKIRVGVAVWCDIDGVSEFSRVQRKFAPPSAIIKSGHGVHIYYFFEELLSISDTLHLVKLAQVCLRGDKQATDIGRYLRIPGTLNVKRKPFVKCEIQTAPCTRYPVEKIEDMLLSAMLADVWVEGLRNQIVLGFSSTVSRAGWTESRCCKIVKRVCEAFDDKEWRNRVDSVRGTYSKSGTGDITSSKGFAEILGGTRHKDLVKIIGCDVQDGEVKYGEQVIGTQATVQQDLVNYMLQDCDWAWAEGQLAKWKESHWVPAEKTTLTSSVFSVMDKLIVVKGSSERKLPAKASIADGVSRIMQGNLAAEPLEPHDPDLIGMNNGVLNLVTGEFRPATKDDRLRRLLPIDYDPDAECPSFHKFLKESVPQTCDFLQDYVGYCLRPGNFFQRMLWAYGQSNTGKSTFLVSIFSMFGPTAVTISSQNISQYQIATLADAYLAVCTELSMQKFRTGTFKALVAGDPVLARHPYGRPFSVEFRGKLMWASNSLPVMDEAEGMWKRLVIVPFDNLPRKLDTTLVARIKSDELPGVFNWGLEGLSRIREYEVEGSWPMPEQSVEMVAHYMEYANMIDIFITEEMERGDYEVGVNEVFGRFIDFCKSMGHPSVEFGAWFVEEFRRRSYKIQNRMTLVGVRLKTMNKLAWGLKGL